MTGTISIEHVVTRIGRKWNFLVKTVAVYGALALAGCGEGTPSSPTTNGTTSPPDSGAVVAASVLVVSGNEQQTRTAASHLDLPLQARVVDPQGQPISGIKVEWRSGDENSSFEPSSATSDATGEVQTNWILGARAGENVAFAVVEQLDSARFTATLRPSAFRVAPFPLLLWPGDTVDVEAVFLDQEGAELEHDPVEWMPSAFEHIETLPGTRVTATTGDGRFEVSGSANGTTLTLEGTVGTALHPIILPVGQQTPDSLWAFLRIDSCIDSVAIAPNEDREWRLPVALSEIPNWEYLVDRAGSGPRSYFPSIARNPDVPASGELRTILTPVNWEFSSGPWEGYSAPVSLARAVTIGERRFPSFIPWSTSSLNRNQLFSWPADRFPIPVYLDHYGSPEGIPSQDSVTVWNYLRNMEARLGLNLFTPVTADDVATTQRTYNEDRAEIPDGDAIAIRFSGGGPASAGESRVPCETDGCATGNLTSGSIDMSRPIWLLEAGTMQHEMLHVLGMGHTCMWPTTMGSTINTAEGMLEFCSRWRLDYPEDRAPAPDAGPGLTPFDAALWLAFHHNLELRRTYPDAMGVWETVYGENLLVLGEGPNDLPGSEEWIPAGAQSTMATVARATVRDPHVARFCSARKPSTQSGIIGLDLP